MTIETFTHQTTEVFLEHNKTSVTVTQWSNCEGINVIMTDDNLSMRFAASLRWEETELLMAAIAAARVN